MTALGASGGIILLKIIHDKKYDLFILVFIPRTAARKTKAKKKLRINWRQCNTSDTVGPSIASKRQGPGANKNKINRKTGPGEPFQRLN